MTLRPLLDFDDPGAGDDHPAKGVTVGDIRAWHDLIADLVEALMEFCCHGLDHPDERLRCRAVSDGNCLREACGDPCGEPARAALIRAGKL